VVAVRVRGFLQRLKPLSLAWFMSGLSPDPLKSDRDRMTIRGAFLAEWI
jgi:hypothetical protein